MKDKFKLIRFLILIFYIISDTKQETISIMKISNLGTQKISLSRNHKIVEFNCTPYFENDNRSIYLLFKERWNAWATLYIFYDKSKINTNSKIKSVGSGYDTEKSLVNLEKLSLSLKQNVGYFVFADFYNDIDTFTIQFFNMNGYYNISNLNNYYFYFPYSSFHFTFSYKKDYSKVKNLLSFEYSSGHTVKTSLYDKNKRPLNTIDKIYGGFSFINYNNIDEFFIKIEVISGGGFNINFLMEDYPNLNYLSQKNNTIRFDLTKYSSYFFYIDITNVPENKINFWSKWSSMENTYVYYYYSNITDIEELKSEFLYRFKKRDRIVDGSTYVSYDKFTIPLNIYSKKLVFIMYPKLKDTDYYVKAIFYSSNEIHTNSNNKFELNNNKAYHIFNYKQKKYFNNSLNGIIYLYLNNSDDDCSLYIYNDLNDIYLENIKNNNGNLKEKNWKSFNYTSGDIYFLITNFKLYQSKAYSLIIINNNDYYDISYYIEKYSNYSLSMKFNKTQNQYITFSISPLSNYYIYFDIMPSNLIINISTLTSKNSTIIPINNKYYLLNKTNDIFFKILLSSKDNFSEFNVNIQKINELPTNFNYFNIGTIILGVIQIIMFIGYIIILKCKRKKEINAWINQDLLIN